MSLSASAMHGEEVEAKRHIPGEFGIWAFIFGDLSVFTFYFLTFAYERSLDRGGFAAGTEALSLTMGIVNTIVLLTSSWFVAMGAEGLRRGNGALAQKYVSLAAVGGLVFIVNKPFEWVAKVNAGYTVHYDFFFQIYYMMTGLHLLHVVVGVVLLTFMWRVAGQVRGTEPSTRQRRFFENGATYWHLVDLIWLVLFALFYLVK